MNEAFTLPYECGCMWRFVLIPHEHWRPDYCKVHEEMVIKKHDEWENTDKELGSGGKQ